MLPRLPFPVLRRAYVFAAIFGVWAFDPPFALGTVLLSLAVVAALWNLLETIDEAVEAHPRRRRLS